MDEKSFKTLHILDEVYRDNTITQRILSRRLGVALGLTNLYLKRLIKKGYIKVVNIKPNRLRYELTPKGISHKNSLTFEYIQHTFHFYREARKSIKECFLDLLGEKCRRVAFYGADEFSEIAYLSLQDIPLEFVGFVDKTKEGEVICGHKVLSPHALKGLDFDRLIVTSFDNTKEVEELLQRFGVREEKVSWIKSLFRA